MSLILNEINYFWKLGFNEDAKDIFVKEYSKEQKIILNLSSKLIDYGDLIEVHNEQMNRFSQKNFIMLEAVDRFLIKEYKPEEIHIGRSSMYDFSIEKKDMNKFVAVKCLEYEEEYDCEVERIKNDPSIIVSFFQKNPEIEFFCLYASRLKAGSIEFRYVVFPQGFSKDYQDSYLGGLLEDAVQPYLPDFARHGEKDIPSRKMVAIVGDFEISNGILMKYTGNQQIVTIPDGVEQLSSSVFWNCIDMKKVIIPPSLYNLAGDTFLDCSNLVDLRIPESVRMMGDNPFAICPQLDLVNESPHFVLEDGILYNRDRTRLIYCSIKRKKPELRIPDGVISIGKHSLVRCVNLRKISIPPSVRIVENNPFSDLPLVKLENNSDYFRFIEGVLYNKTMSTLFFYEQSSGPRELSIPEGVRIVGRHSFYNCLGIHKIIIPSSVEIIGYNPFAGCPLLSLENHSPNYTYENGVLYDKTKSELIYYSLTKPEERFVVPDTVKTIGRSAFYKCGKLKEIVLPDTVTTIRKTAFAGCRNLERIRLSKNLKRIEGLVFDDCMKLNKVNIPNGTKWEVSTFFNCNAERIVEAQ
jgi:hypothetical protein